MKTTIQYYMKGEPRATMTFDTLKEAQAFMQGLSTNPNCEAYGIVRN